MKKLSKQATILLIVGILYTAATLIASTFVTVYLYGINKDYSVSIIINIINYIVVVSSFVIGSKIVKKTGILNLMRVGIISTGIYYLLILILKENAGQVYNMIPLGIFNGIGMGFYYFSLNNMISKLTTDENRSNYFGMQMALSTVFGVVIPPVSGLLIKSMSEQTGYYILFGFSCVVFAIGFIYSMMLKQIDFKEDYNIFGVLKLTGNLDWSTIKWQSFSVSLRDALYMTIFTVYSTQIIGGEDNMGILSAVMSIISVVAAGYIGRAVTNRNIKNYHIITTAVMLVAMYIGAIFASPLAIIVMCLLLGFAKTGGMLVYNNVQYKGFASAEKYGFKTADFIVATEFPIAVGRIVGLVGYYVATLFIHDDFLLSRIVFILIPLLTIIDHFVIQKNLGWFRNRGSESVSE